MVPDKRIRQINPLFNTATPLGDIPEDWLRFIEPYVIRGVFLPCWVWRGSLDNQGYPKMYCPYTGKRVYTRRWVMKIFFDFPDDYIVGSIPEYCATHNCVRPHHMAITFRNNPRFKAA